MGVAKCEASGSGNYGVGFLVSSFEFSGFGLRGTSAHEVYGKGVGFPLTCEHGTYKTGKALFRQARLDAGLAFKMSNPFKLFPLRSAVPDSWPLSAGARITYKTCWESNALHTFNQATTPKIS